MNVSKRRSLLCGTAVVAFSASVLAGSPLEAIGFAVKTAPDPEPLLLTAVGVLLVGVALQLRKWRA